MKLLSATPVLQLHPPSKPITNNTSTGETSWELPKNQRIVPIIMQRTRLLAACVAWYRTWNAPQREEDTVDDRLSQIWKDDFCTTLTHSEGKESLLTRALEDFAMSGIDLNMFPGVIPFPSANICCFACFQLPSESNVPWGNEYEGDVVYLHSQLSACSNCLRHVRTYFA